MHSHKFISVRGIADDWLTRLDPDPEEVKLEQWVDVAEGIARKMLIKSQLRHEICLLKVKDYVGMLPDNFGYVIQAAFRRDAKNDKKSNVRTRISKWVKDLYDGCQIEMYLKCPRCHEEKCDCDSKITTIEVDRTWEMNNPQLFVHYMDHFHGYGNMTAEGPRCTYDNDFILMGYRSNTMFNVPYHISKCVNINLDCTIEYELDNPKMIVNCEEGQVLLSYLGYRTDEDGYRMVPDDEYVVSAILAGMEEIYALKRYRKKQDNKTRTFWLDMKNEAFTKLTVAKSRLSFMDQDEFLVFLENHWRKRIPYSTYYQNLDRKSPDVSRFPNESYERLDNC